MAQKKFVQHRQPVVDVKKATPAVLPQNNLAVYAYVAILFLVSFIFSRSPADPALVPRYVFMSIVTGLFLLLFYVPVKSLKIAAPFWVKFIFITGFAFIMWCGISLLQAVNAVNGIYEVARLALNLIFLFISVRLFTTHTGAVNAVTKLFVVLGFFHACIGLLQLSGIAFTQLPGANSLPYGLMANRNLFASALLFCVPGIAYVGYTQIKAWRLAAIIAGLFVTTALIFSQTRSAWLGFFVFALTACSLVFIFVKEQRKKAAQFFGAIILGSIVLAFCLIKLGGSSKISAELAQRSGSLVGAAATNSTSVQSMDDRYRIWAKTTEVVKDNIMTGVGVGNWKLVVLGYGAKGLAWSEGYYVPDRVHNIYLQTLAETGIIGLVLFLAFWGGIGFAGLQVLRSSIASNTKILTAIMLGGLASLASDGFFSFPLERFEHTAFVLCMAAIVLANYSKIHQQVQPPKLVNMSKITIAIMLIICAGNIYIGTEKFRFEENMQIVKALEKQNRYADMISYAETGKSAVANVDEPGFSLEGKEAVAYKELKQYDAAKLAMQTAMAYNPNSPMVFNNLGTIYTSHRKFDSAIIYYEKALKLTPDFVLVKKNLALNFYYAGRYKSADSILALIDYTGEPALVEIKNATTKMLADSSVMSK